MITDLGSHTLAEIVPAAADATAAIEVTADIAAPNVSAQLTALASFTPSVTLSLADQLAQAQAIVASIQAAITAGITPPSLDVQVALAAAAVAALQAKLEAIQVQVDFAAALGELLATGDVRLLAFSGAQNDLGSELAAELGGDATSAHALVLVTTSGASWTAMQGVFKTAP
jgi:hypothetical protein